MRMPALDVSRRRQRGFPRRWYAASISLLAVVTVVASLALTLVSPPRSLQARMMDLAEPLAGLIGFDLIRPPGPVDAPGFLVHNGMIGIKHNDSAKGFLMLYWHNPESGDWELFNSIVPMAKVGWFSNNAEFQRPDVEAVVVKDEFEYKKVRYEYSPFANGAHFSLVAEFKRGEPWVRITVEPEPGSARIEEFGLQTTLGFVDAITTIETEHHVYRASTYDVQDDYMRGGLWFDLRRDGRRLVLRGEQLVQVQELETDLRDQDRVEVEVRRTPWLRFLPDPGRNWFELIRIIRKPFEPNKAVWRFGLDLDQKPTMNRDNRA